jgi:hypothetical protein
MKKAVNDLRAKYNTNGNAVIPNTFQHPNIFVDRLMYYLSPVENIILTFAVRRILGFQKNIMSRRDNISLSQFTEEIVAADGCIISMGCGVGVDATIKALEVLTKFRILLPTTAKPDQRKGQEYWLQDNENNIDWEGLLKRKDEKTAKYRKQTQKARYSVEQRGSVQQRAEGSVEQRASPLLNRDTKPIETQRNPFNGAYAPKNEKPDLMDAILENEGVGQKVRDAAMEFEAAFGVTSWPWGGQQIWRKFAAWVSGVYGKDPGAFLDYAAWRDGEGKYQGAMTNTAIRRNPQIFMDTGWPTFLAYTAVYRGRQSEPGKFPRFEDGKAVFDD